MKKAKSTFYSVIIIVVSIAACWGAQYYRSPADDDSCITVKDLSGIMDKMSESIGEFLKDKWKEKAYLHIKKIRNRTSEHIDTMMVTELLITKLVNKGIYVLDPEKGDCLVPKNRNNISLDGSCQSVPENVRALNEFALSGAIYDRVRYAGNRRIQNVVFSLKMVHLKSGIIKWKKDEHLVKSSLTKKISF